MALADALLLLARRWPDVAAQLSPEQIGFVRRSLAAAVHGAEWDPGRLLTVVAEHEPEDSELWRALARPGERLVAEARPDVGAAASRLRWTIELLEGAHHEETATTDVDEIEEEAEDRLFTVPMTPATPDAARRQILVIDHQGMSRAPMFQFNPHGEPLGEVVEVNAVLGAANDPWGVASWWLTPHATLQAIPADAVRTGRGPDVVAAARAADHLP